MSRCRYRGLAPQAFLPALAGLLLLAGPLVAPAAAAPDPSGEAVAEDSRNWFDEMGAFYEANPHLKDQKGSGWKPYNRLKWFTEQRMVNGQLPAPAARWNAHLYKKEVEARMPPARNTWFSLGPDNFAGRMLSMDFDPNVPTTVYVGGADGGVWRSTNSGGSWTPLSDEIPSLAVGGLAVSKTNPNIIVIGTGEPTPNVDRVTGVGILRSTDAGATWITTSLSFGIPSGHGFHFVECGPNGTLLAGASDGFYRSSDNGATWTDLNVGDGGGDWYDAVWSPLDANTVYAVRGNANPGARVKKSTDDGLTWSNAGTGQPTSGFFGKSKLGISGSTIYCYIGVAGTGGGIFGIIKSTDDGATWTQPAGTGLPSSGSSSQSWYNLACAADPDNADRVIVGDVQVYRSGDGGNFFNNVTSGVHADQHVLKYEPGSNSNLWIGSDGGMWRSLSDGQNGTWVDMNNGLVTYQFYDICVNNGPGPYYMLGGTQDQGTDRWSGTTTWTDEIGADGMVCNVSESDGTVVLAEIQFGDHRRSTNSGLSFIGFNSGITGTGKWVTPVGLSYTNSSHSLTETSAGIFRSTNGSTWSQVATHQATWIDYSRANGNIAWTVAGSNGYVTTDNGTSWTSFSFGFPTSSATKVLTHPTDQNTAWVTFGGYGSLAHIAMTTDLGATWTDVSGDFPAVPANAIAVDPSNPGDWYVGTDVGCWHSSNGGVNWTPYETGLPNAVVVDLEIRDADRKLVAGTHGRGAWEIDIPPSSVVDADVIVQGPRNLMLDRPSPNPVNDRTLLRYAAKSDSPVHLRVYDVNGRLVSDLESFSSGDGIVRTTPWFTDDVPTGVYFAVLQTAEGRKTQKITVLK